MIPKARSLGAAALIGLMMATPVARAQDDLALEAPPRSGDKGVTDPKIVIVNVKGKGGPNLNASTKKYIEKALKAEDFTLVPFAKFKKAAQQAKVKPKDYGLPSSVQLPGERAGATHVLIIEGLMEKQQVGKRKKPFYFAEISLIEVTNGDVVYTKRWDLQGRAINKVTGTNIVSELSKALSPPPPAPALPEPVEEDPPAPPAPPPPAPAASTPPPDSDVPLSEPPAEEPVYVASDVDTAEPAITAEPDIVAPSPMVAVAPEPAVSTTYQPEPQRRGRWRPGLHVVGGVLAMSRTARIRAPNAPLTPPCYCTDGTNQEFVVFPAGYLAAEIFPLAFGGTGSWIEGLGLHLEGYGTMVETIINGADDRVQSLVWGGRGGLSYRIVFWDSPTAIDFRVDLGLSYASFPLEAGAFPGVGYFGQLYAGGMFTIPLFTEYIALLAGGTYTILMEPGEQSQEMGDRVARTTQFLVQGGLRSFIDPVEIRLMFRYERSEQRYGGTTSLDEVPVQFSGAKLTDEYVGGIAAVGVAF